MLKTNSPSAPKLFNFKYPHIDPKDRGKGFYCVERVLLNPSQHAWNLNPSQHDSDSGTVCPGPTLGPWDPGPDSLKGPSHGRSWPSESARATMSWYCDKLHWHGQCRCTASALAKCRILAVHLHVVTLSQCHFFTDLASGRYI